MATDVDPLATFMPGAQAGFRPATEDRFLMTGDGRENKVALPFGGRAPLDRRRRRCVKTAKPGH